MRLIPLAVLLAFTLPADAGEHTYSFTLLPDLGPGVAKVVDINDAGLMCGEADWTASGESYGVLWHDGAIYSLGELGEGSWRLKGINNSGECVGTARLGPDDLSRAVRWTDADGDLTIDAGEMTILHLGAASSVSIGAAINTSGAICGHVVAEGGTQQAFIAGGPSELISPFGSLYSGATAINDLNQVTGSYWATSTYEAFLHGDGGTVPIDGLGGFLTAGYGMNNHGQVVGEAYRGETITAFLWLPEPAYGLPAGTHDVAPDGIASWANDINGNGVIVGRSYFADVDEVRTVAWFPNGDGTFEMVDLHAAAGVPGGLTMVEAYAINSGGMIVGRAKDGVSFWRPVLLTPPEQDTDGDGLPDDWEINGVPYVDGAGVDQRYLLDVDDDGLSDADPMHKDLFVEIDAMDGFSPPSLEDVVIAFALAPVGNPDGATGIRLHLHLDEQDLDHVEVLAIGPDDYGFPPAFFDYQTDHFGTDAEHGQPGLLDARSKAFRYCLFADQDADGDLGVAVDLHGDGFIVLQGEHDGLCDSCTEAENEAIIRSTFMHEFGHTLNLTHGGNDDVNYKPNYVSVMNYMEAVPYSLSHQLWQLDFSRGTLPDLVEQDLDETAGLVDPTGAMNGRQTYHGAIACSGGPCDAESAAVVPIEALTVGALAADWNGDDTVEPGACGDLNYYGDDSGFPGADAASPCDVMRDHDDWGNLKYEIPEPSPMPREEIHELTGDMVRAMFELLPRTCYADIAPDHGDGEVGIEDLLELLANWGACTDCRADIEPRLFADRVVDVQDLLVMLSSWGECP